MPATTGTPTALQRVEMKDDKRYGFAGLGGFLANTSLGERTSPTLRGRWIMLNLLCVHPPEPPQGIPPLPDGLNPDIDVRVALQKQRESPQCASCHAVFDPYGMSLEHFDAIGRYRSKYPVGTAIDASVDLRAGTDAVPEGAKFSGLEGLADTLSKSKRFSECVSEFMFSYSLGRQMSKVEQGETDKPYLHAMHEEWTKKGTPTLRRLIHQLVLAETFRFRHGAAAK